MSKSGTIQAVIAAILALGVVAWLHFSVFDKTIDLGDPSYRLNYSSNRSVSDDALIQAIELMNRSCPREIDSHTRIDSVTYHPGKIFAEYFTFIDLDKSAFDYEKVKDKIEEKLIEQIKTSSAFAMFKNNNYNFAFIYYDKSGELLFNLIITPEKYNN